MPPGGTGWACSWTTGAPCWLFKFVGRAGLRTHRRSSATPPFAVPTATWSRWLRKPSTSRPCASGPPPAAEAPGPLPSASPWGRTFESVPLMEDQELDSRLTTGAVYWEGASTLLEAGRPVGRGYLEMTGYQSPSDSREQGGPREWVCCMPSRNRQKPQGASGCVRV